MNEALALAREGLCITSPNPRVGCVLVDAGGEVIGRGSTQRAGGPHAEVMALRDAAARNRSTVGSTAYVTLEPCSHQGRTGPCCDALVAAGVARVVASSEDPNPKVRGEGFRRLRAAGVDVSVGDGAVEARELNIGFFSRMLRARPWVRMKIAASLDGFTALPGGESQWITSPAARDDVQQWRARACALLTGIGTIVEDDPQLDVRLADVVRQPHLVVVDSRLELQAKARILKRERTRWLYAATADAERTSTLSDARVEVIRMPNGAGKVDLEAMVRDLAAREVNELHVEAGARLNGSLLRAGVVDEVLLYTAPVLLGAGRPLAACEPLTSLAAARAMRFVSHVPVGPDVRVLARFVDHESF